MDDLDKLAKGLTAVIKVVFHPPAAFDAVKAFRSIMHDPVALRQHIERTGDALP